MKYEIKNRWTGQVIYQDEAESFSKLVMAAIKANADLQSANLQSADLRSADLRWANLRWANLQSADLRWANLRWANLQSADLQSANLQSADLKSADLQSADLKSADLQSANLQSADLKSADLQSANLQSADLQSADLQSADLKSADLKSANLQSADLRWAKNLNKYLVTPLLILKDQPGKIRAYKLVNQKGEGPMKGGIVFALGKKYSVSDADTTDEPCGKGINLATLDWVMNEWQEGYKILIAEFTAKDIASIPIATDGKFRVHRCKIIGQVDLKEIGLIK